VSYLKTRLKAILTAEHPAPHYPWVKVV